jgi:hypothetical protein
MKTIVLTIVPFICDNSESLNWSDIAQTIKKKKCFPRLDFLKEEEMKKILLLF